MTGTQISTFAKIKYLRLNVDKHFTRLHLKARHQTLKSRLHLFGPLQTLSKNKKHFDQTAHTDLSKPIWYYSIQIWVSEKPLSTKIMQSFEYFIQYVYRLR